MKASVIIPTFNGSKKIKPLLQALAGQTQTAAEVIVVDDGSTEEVQGEVLAYKGVLPMLQFVRQTNQGRAAARNKGASFASGDILIFFDDDVTPEANAVEAHLQFHANHPNALLAGNIVEVIHPDFSDVINYKASRVQRWVAAFPQGVTKLNLQNVFFAAANCSLPRKVFSDLGGFDARLRDAEDYDLAVRALGQKLDVYYDAAPVVTHRENITCISYVNRLREYRNAHEQLLKLHPERRHAVQSYSKLRTLFYFPFSSPLLARAIDAGIFRFMPQRVRYRFYDVVIHALANLYPHRKLTS